MNIDQFKVEKLSLEDQTISTGGFKKGGFWGLLIYIADEIYEGCKRPLEC